MTTKLTSGICITKTKDDDGRTCYEWLFDLNGESFGGYGRTASDAGNDAGIVLKSAVANLSESDIDAAYERLVGYAPIADDGLSLDDAKKLLFERMREGE